MEKPNFDDLSVEARGEIMEGAQTYHATTRPEFNGAKAQTSPCQTEHKKYRARETPRQPTRRPSGRH
jgi:hypothetical protein